MLSPPSPPSPSRPFPLFNLGRTSEEALVDNLWQLTCAPGGYSNGDSITYDAAHPLIIAAGMFRLTACLFLGGKKGGV